MKQIGHTWIALRAIALLQEDAKTRDLAGILAPWAKHSYIGCWLPDMAGFKKGHGIVANHTFKNAPYDGPNKSRFVLPKAKLLKSLDPNLALAAFLARDSSLPQQWWETPYKAEQKQGEHLPDCLSSLFDTISDMLLLGDPALERLVPGQTGYGGYLDGACALSPPQVATFFFILSHYVADCFMPCHADKRTLSAFAAGGVHEGWEKHWDKLAGPYFGKAGLKKCGDTDQAVIDRTRDLDAKLGLVFASPVSWPDNGDDIWETAICWCRASFAFACDVFPLARFPFGGRQKPLFEDYFKDPALLSEYDRIVLQSGVYAVAGAWKRIWRKFG